MFRLTKTAANPVSRTLTRSIYTVPHVSVAEENKDSGISGLYSKEGLEKAWFQRANRYVENLNSFASQTGQNHTIEEILEVFYKEPHKKSLYENASLLQNIKYAFESISPINNVKDVKKAQIPENLTVSELLKSPVLETESALSNVPANSELKDWIVDSFGSILEFKTLLINSALGIKGDGFVWVVAEKLVKRSTVYETLYVLNTYNCGQPNSNYASHLDNLKRVQKEQDAKQNEIDLEEIESSKLFSTDSNLISSLEEAHEKFHGRKRRFEPILAIDASPKAYLHDFGVFGKKAYLEKVWDSINWNVVASRMPKRAANLDLF